MGKLLTYINMVFNVVASLCLVALISSVNGDVPVVPDLGSSGLVRSSFGSGSDGFGLGSGISGSGFSSFGRGGSGLNAGRDTVIVTQTRTIDQIETRVSTVFNTQPVTQTDFVLQTVTSQTYQVIRTPGNDVVRFSTVAVVQPVVEEVTDVWRNYVLNTRQAEQVVDVLREVQNVDFVTVTRPVQEEIAVTEQLVQTQVVTDYNQVTDYRYVTHYEYVQAGGKRGGFANYFASEFGHGSNGNFGSGYA